VSRLLCLAALGLLAAGCAMTPAATPGLESARLSFAQAAGHPEVPLRAPVELQVAERSLAQAERLWRDGADPALVAHHAYLADQRARIAMASADYRKAEALVATSGEQRNRVLLEARTRELEAQEARTRELEAQKLASGPARVALAAEIDRLQSQISELKAQPTGRGWVLTLSGDLLFDSGGAVLKPGGEKAVENLAQLMRREPEPGIIVEGFTDSTGPAELNRRLSEQRAQAVRDALVARGVAAQRIQARGYGPAYPVASNDTPVGRQLNRRVQVVIATILQ
jgi:outer membrane protein OmpA-like peptidoglycan-associated protein